MQLIINFFIEHAGLPAAKQSRPTFIKLFAVSGFLYEIVSGSHWKLIWRVSDGSTILWAWWQVPDGSFQVSDHRRKLTNVHRRHKCCLNSSKPPFQAFACDCGLPVKINAVVSVKWKLASYCWTFAFFPIHRIGACTCFFYELPRQSTPIQLAGRGDASMIHAAYSNFSQDDIVENIMACLNSVATNMIRVSWSLMMIFFRPALILTLEVTPVLLTSTTTLMGWKVDVGRCVVARIWRQGFCRRTQFLANVA